MIEKLNTTEKNILNIIEPILEDTEYTIYDITFTKEAGDYFLRIYIDKDGGIDLDDCENVTNMINDTLDKEDPIKNGYYLEVSSPGIERNLRFAEQYQLVLGGKIYVKTFTKIENKKEHTGILKEVSNSGITLDLDGSLCFIEFEQIAKANLSVF